MPGTPALHRVKVDSDHFNMVRRYMVDRNMRSAASAAEEMIEIAAAAAKAASDDVSDQRPDNGTASRHDAHRESPA